MLMNFGETDLDFLYVGESMGETIKDDPQPHDPS